MGFPQYSSDTETNQVDARESRAAKETRTQKEVEHWGTGQLENIDVQQKRKIDMDWKPLHWNPSSFREPKIINT